ncbi:MAG: hypothetical protein ACHQEB_05155 [Chitinophagales bacterium]
MKETNSDTEKILNSLDGVKRMPAPGFFYTRLKARMEKELIVNANPKWILRPVVIVSALVLLLTVNAVVILQHNDGENEMTSTDNESQQTIASAYQLTDNSPYDINQ